MCVHVYPRVSLTVVWLEPRKVRMPRMKSPKVKGSPSSNRSRPESTHHQRRPTKLLRYSRNCLAHATKYCSFRRPFLQHNTIFHRFRQTWCNSYISTVDTVVIVHLNILSHMLTNNHPVTQQDQSVHHCAPLNCRICFVNTVGICEPWFLQIRYYQSVSSTYHAMTLCKNSLHILGYIKQY